MARKSLRQLRLSVTQHTDDPTDVRYSLAISYLTYGQATRTVDLGTGWLTVDPLLGLPPRDVALRMIATALEHLQSGQEQLEGETDPLHG